MMANGSGSQEGLPARAELSPHDGSFFAFSLLLSVKILYLYLRARRGRASCRPSRYRPCPSPRPCFLGPCDGDWISPSPDPPRFSPGREFSAGLKQPVLSLLCAPPEYESSTTQTASGSGRAEEYHRASARVSRNTLIDRMITAPRTRQTQ